MQLDARVFGLLYKQEGTIRHYAGYDNLQSARVDSSVTSSVEHAGVDGPEDFVEINDTDKSQNLAVGFKKISDGSTHLIVTNAGGDRGAYVEVSLSAEIADPKYLDKGSLLGDDQHVGKVKIAQSDERDIWLHATGAGTDRLFKIGGGTVTPVPTSGGA